MELNELRKIAEAVKQEPWVLAGGNEWISPIGITVDYDNGGVSSIEAEFIATFDPPTVLALLSRLEQAERELVAVKSTQVQHIVTTSFETARAAGIALDEAVKLVAGWLVDDPDRRAREAEQDRDKLRNRLDAMSRQRDGYRNQLRKTEQQVARVREVLEYSKANSAVARVGLRALDGDGRG